MRTNPTDAEGFMECTARSALKQAQVSIHGFIVDFVCFHAKLIIEVDGTQHAENDYDVQRNQKLTKDGFEVLRFWNDDALRDLENVCAHIVQIAILRRQ